MANNKCSYVTLFSSAGVGCYGFQQHGFECIATNELIERRMQVQRNNKKCKQDDGYILGDIFNDEIYNKIITKVNEYKENESKDIDFLIATPPCQGMSVANHKKTKSDKERNSLVVESIKLTHEIKPIVFIYENVRSFLKTICSDLDGYDKVIGESIRENLSKDYIITSRIVNFKDYGVPSSRTRTLVIGVKKSEVNLHPSLLFPYKRKLKTLREAIGHLPSLKKMGDFWEENFLHFYRYFDEKMLPWIENLKEGESAFNNTEEHRIPHRLVDGEIILNVNKNADKYKKQIWDAVGPCVHTRNDILSSQNTVHPSDNRVFSLRELMIMMSIPESFNWFDKPFVQLNSLSKEEKLSILKQNERNIRQSIGESVPTKIFNDIAERYNELKKSKFQLNYQVEDLDEYLSLINSLFEKKKKEIIKIKKKKEIIKIKLINPDEMTLLLFYSSAIMFEEKRIDLEVISKKNIVSKLDLPNHFSIKKNIEKGYLLIYWKKTSNDNLKSFSKIKEGFDERIIVASNEHGDEICKEYPVKQRVNFDRLNTSILLIQKDNQFEMF